MSVAGCTNRPNAGECVQDRVEEMRWEFRLQPLTGGEEGGDIHNLPGLHSDSSLSGFLPLRLASSPAFVPSSMSLSPSRPAGHTSGSQVAPEARGLPNPSHPCHAFPCSPLSPLSPATPGLYTLHFRFSHIPGSFPMLCPPFGVSFSVSAWQGKVDTPSSESLGSQAPCLRAQDTRH